MPHRYCDNHFLRDLAKPLLEQDSHAKVTMRKKVRGLRSIERDVLEQRHKRAVQEQAPVQPPKTSEPVAGQDNRSENDLARQVEAEQIMLDYCTATRGIVNNDQGGPLGPPGLRMAESLQQVRNSIQRNLDAQKKG
ncbi:MAG: hypothetical protein WBC05_15880 [Sedimentisphaerales bacterium]